MNVTPSSFQKILRNVAIIAVGVLSLIATTTALKAQPATRIAYIDVSKLLKKMPEATDATARLQQLVATWNHDADAMQSELDRKQQDYERRKLIMTDAERSATELNLQDLKKKLSDFRQSKYGPDGDFEKQQAELMKPAYDRLLKAVQEAAEDGKFDYVIDRSSTGMVMLYSNSKFDLTVTVARKLGIESDVITKPLIGNGPGTTPKPAGQQPNSMSTPPQVTPPFGKLPTTLPSGQPGNPNPIQIPPPSNPSPTKQ